MEIIVCTECRGFGLVEYDIGTHKSKYKITVCEKCNGSGRLEKITNVTYKPFIPIDNKALRRF